MIRILLAEDDDAMRSYLARALENAGYDVAAVDRGTAALPLLQAEDFDLLLSDIVMPDMDGFQVLKALRANPTTAKLPVILVTGHADEHIIAKVRAPETRADGIIAKPLSLATLEQKVVSVLTAHGLSR